MRYRTSVAWGMCVFDSRVWFDSSLAFFISSFSFALYMIKKTLSGSEAKDYVSIVALCVFAIGDLQSNRLVLCIHSPHNIQWCLNTLSTEWTPVNRSVCLLFNK